MPFPRRIRAIAKRFRTGLSYVNDFTPVKAKMEGIDEKADILTRRNFNISLGYALKL